MRHIRCQVCREGDAGAVLPSGIAVDYQRPQVRFWLEHSLRIQVGARIRFRLLTQTHRYSDTGVMIAYACSHKHTGTQLRELQMLPSIHTNLQVLSYGSDYHFRLFTRTYRYSVIYGSYKCFPLLTKPTGNQLWEL